jgi:hypothetical protein
MPLCIQKQTPSKSLASLWNQNKDQLLHGLALENVTTNLQYYNVTKLQNVTKGLHRVIK